MKEKTARKNTAWSAIAIWLLWSVIHYFLLDQILDEHWQAATDSLISNIYLGLFAWITGSIYRYYQPARQAEIRRLMVSALLAFLCAGISEITLSEIYAEDPAYLSFLKESLGIRFLLVLLLIAFVTLMTRMIAESEEKRRMMERREEQERLMRESELARLKLQLQPHFLFNSLNSVNALIGISPDKAREMIQKLSQFLRSTLQRNDHEMVSIEEEINYLKLYLEIEEIRFGDRLRQDWQAEAACNEKKIPSFLLQPLIENAVKHGIYGTEGEVIISTSIHSDDDYLYISIMNPYSNIPTEHEGTGFGQQGIMRRLQLLYKRNDLFEAKAGKDSYQVQLRIPQKNK
jgi:sensor histidine kinase YesM